MAATTSSIQPGNLPARRRFLPGEDLGLLTTPAPDAILVPQDERVYDKLLHDPRWTEAWHDSIDSIFLPVKAAPR